ncbi:MAG: hypothetical protein ABIR46_01690, partial [Candidatus Saccharimonadales bacterium]
SRRGRQVGVHEVDMNGIDIESNVEAPKTTKKETKPAVVPSPKQSVTKPKRDRTPWSKRKRLTVLAVVLAIVITPLIVAELVTAQYSTGTSGAKSDIDKLVSSTVLPAQKKSSVTADDVRNIAGKVNDIASQMCSGGLLDNMAKLYPRAKSAYDNCKETQNKYVTLTNTLYVLEAQARYLEKVDIVIKPVSVPITDEYAVIGSQQTAWLKAAEDFKKLNPPSEFKATHTELATHLNAVADNWSKLSTANNGQDPAAFEEAEKALNVEYEAIRSTSGEFVSILSSTQTNVLNAYNATK